MFYKRLLTVAACLGALGVMFGAFGAHFLKSRLPNQDLETIKTAVLYLFVHTLVILWIYAVSRHHPDNRRLRASGIAFIAGVIMFSGSLFVIATSKLTGFPVSAIGFITPLGGLSFIVGWLLLVFHNLKT